MKFQFALFYASLLAFGVASQELLEIDAEKRVLKGAGGKGGGSKGSGGAKAGKDGEGGGGGGGKDGGGGGGGGGAKAGKGGGGGGKVGKGGGGSDKGGKDGKAAGGKDGKAAGGKDGKAGGKSAKAGGKAGGKSGKADGKTAKAGGREAGEGSKSAKTYYSKSAKGTAAPTSSLAPTMLLTEPKGKSKGTSESVDLSWCPFGGSSGSKSKGKSSTGKRRMLKGKSGKGESSESSGSSDSSGADLSNALGQEPGSSLLIQPMDDMSLCVQPVALEAGAGLEGIACTYDDADAFRVDRYGRLHSSQWSLCVTGDAGALVLGSCDTCDAIFQYDPTSMMISPFADDSTVFSLKNGKMSLQEPAPPPARKERFFFALFQIFVIVLFTGVPPTGSPAPTGSLVPL